MKNKITIVGAGPAGLFCSYQLLKLGFRVDLYDQSSGVGKKFLVAGNGGLNLTHSEEICKFSQKYSENQSFFSELIKEFTPDDLQKWCNEIGVETFVGSSGRVFPKTLSAADILLKWSAILKNDPNFNLYLNHKLVSLDNEKNIQFDFKSKILNIKTQILILGLGGSSWKKTGSDGKWKEILENLQITVEKFEPMNCGFETNWSDHFKSKIEYSPLKNIAVQIGENKIKGELMLTPFGLEGGAIYAHSKKIRTTITLDESALIHLDLKPDLSVEEIIIKISKNKNGNSLSNHLRKNLGFSKKEMLLLYELISKEDLKNIKSLGFLIKNLPLVLLATRPLDEAISTSGGVSFHELTKNLESKKIPGLYIVGEMLAFDAPTGGYLLQGCFSTAYRVSESIKKSEIEQ